MAAICALYLTAQQLAQAGVYIVSSDEKTGIQALERKHPSRPMIAGKVELREFEYIRHGTLALIASFAVATGLIITASVGPTRKEEDFADHIEAVIASEPKAGWIFIVDQLNTHKSETLVRLVAKHCGIKQALGIKGKSGILQSMPSAGAGRPTLPPSRSRRLWSSRASRPSRAGVPSRTGPTANWPMKP